MLWEMCQLQLIDIIIEVCKRFDIYKLNYKNINIRSSQHPIINCVIFQVQHILKYLRYDSLMNFSGRVRNSCTKYRSPTHVEVCVTRVTALQHKMEWEFSSLRCTRVSSSAHSAVKRALA